MPSKELFLEMPTSCGLVRGSADDWLTFEATLLDASGSMREYRSAPRDAYAAAIASYRESSRGDRIVVSLDTFNNTSRSLISPCLASLAHVPEVIRTDGNTLLFQTVLKKLEDWLPAYHRAVEAGNHANVKIVVYTDGRDNLSTDLDWQMLQQRAAEARQAEWGLYVNAFGLDAAVIARSMGFPDDPEHAVTMSATVESIHSAASRAASHTREFSVTRPSTMNYMEDDLKKPPRT